MANDLLNPPQNETDESVESVRLNGRGPGAYAAATAPGETGHELDAFLGKAFDEKPVWKDLYDNLHDLFFPVKLPPLELTSTPIAVADPLAVKRSPAAVAISTLINCGILAVLLFAFRNQIGNVITKTATSLNIDVSAWKPQTTKPSQIGGGGGGGAHEMIQANKGHLPKLDPKPLLQPTPVKIDNPKIPMVPSIDVQKDIKLPDNPNMPLIGVTNSPNVTLASAGSGSNGGMGNGQHGGLGGGNGDGLGPGEGGNVGGGLRRVGNGVSAPTLLYKVEAEFSDEARRAKYEGVVMVSLVVDANGNPQQVKILRPLGMGLDEKALEAVRQYKFKPAFDKVSGKNVPVMMSVEIDFHLY
jgi:periplasmic protein TonB